MADTNEHGFLECTFPLHPCVAYQCPTNTGSEQQALREWMKTYPESKDGKRQQSISVYLSPKKTAKHTSQSEQHEIHLYQYRRSVERSKTFKHFFAPTDQFQKTLKALSASVCADVVALNGTPCMVALKVVTATSEHWNAHSLVDLNDIEPVPKDNFDSWVHVIFKSLMGLSEFLKHGLLHNPDNFQKLAFVAVRVGYNTI